MTRTRLIRVVAVAAALATLLTLALPGPASAGAIPSGWNPHEWCKAGNCNAGYVTGETYGVEVYSDTTGDTKYYYGKLKWHIEWGAKRQRAYFVRLYGYRGDGSRVLLARNETDAVSVGGSLTLRTPAAYTSKAPCELRVASTVATRWNDDTVGTRNWYSDYFPNYANPNCA